ncbi:TetR/AcrR family transcriptional regulator [Nocardia thailandica]
MARIASATGRYAGRSADERRAERRARIRESGLTAFGAGVGYRRTRLADLCAAARVSTRQFYEEYDTVEDLLTELHTDIDTAVEKHVRDEIGRVEDLPLADRAEAMLRAYLVYATRDPRCARLVFVESLAAGDRMEALLRARRATWTELLRAMFDAFADRGEIARRDFAPAAATFVQAVKGVLHGWILGWVEATTEQLTHELLRMLLGILGAAPPRAEPREQAPRADPGAPAVRRRPRDRRATILRAADAAFARKGFHRTSMADIAAAVGISPTALYRHFRTKQELLGCSLREGLDTVLARVEGARDDAEVLPALVRVALETRGLARLWQLEFRNLTPADRVGVLARSVRLTHLVDRAVAARRPELAGADRELLNWAVLSVVTSPSNHRTRLPDEQFAAVLDGVVEAVITTPMPAPALGRPVSPVPGPPEDGTADQMITGAARLFHRRGFGAVSIEDIGAAVGVSGPALYHHFASKADLLEEVVARNNRWVHRYTEQARADGEDANGYLRLVLRYYVEFGMAQPDLIGTAVSEVGHLPEDAAARYRRTHREGIIEWAGLLRMVRPEVSMPTARVLIHATATLVNDGVRNPRLTRRADLADQLCALGERIVLADISPRTGVLITE